MGEKGDRSVEFETTGSFVKPQGLCDSIEQEFIFENTLTDSLGLELGAHLLGQDVQRVSGLPGFVGVNFMGLSAEFRYALIHRTANLPIQVTLTAQPEWDAVSDAGQQIVDYNATFRAIAEARIRRSASLWHGQHRLHAGRLALSWPVLAGFGDPGRLRRAFLSPDAAADIRRGGGL